MEQDKMDALFAGIEYDIQLLKHQAETQQAVMKETQFSFIDKFETHVAKQPKKPFVIYDGLVYTYEAIDRLACKVANIAKSWNLKPNNCVAIMIQNEVAFIYTFLGLQKLGIPVALINTNLAGHSLVHCVTAAECKALIVGSGNEMLKAVTDILPQLEKVPVYVQDVRQSLPAGIKSFDDLMKETYLGNPSSAVRAGVTPQDTCCYIYTSGTTGNPKPVYISHLKASLTGVVMNQHLSPNPHDVTYVSTPLYHSVGLIVSFGGALATGSTLFMRKKFSARHFWDDCRKYDVTVFHYVGELVRYLLSQPKSELDGVHKIRGIVGAGLRADIWEEVKRRFKIPLMVEFYGASEGFTGMSNNFGKPGAVGRMSPFLSRFDPDNKCLVKFDTATALPIRDRNGRCIKVEIGEPGLLISKTPEHLMGKQIYKAGPEATEKKLLRDVFVPGDSYMNYGDAFVLDKEYFVYFYDRLGDTFRWKGENVSTKEVGNVISALPFVEDANVYGVEVPRNDGKAGMAAINLIPNAQFGNKELQELYREVCKELPVYARPLFIRHIPEAVLTGTFKNKKVDFAKEGFDLNKVNDPLYFIDHENKTYSPLTKSILAKFISSRL